MKNKNGVNRRTFIKRGCARGALVLAGAPQPLHEVSAADAPPKDDPTRPLNPHPGIAVDGRAGRKLRDWQVEFIRARPENLLNIIATTLDEPTLAKVLGKMGRECGRAAAEGFEAKRLPTASESTDSKMRILVVDDHTLTRIGLTCALNNQPDMQVVAEAGDGPQAIEACHAHRPDVVILDLRPLNQSGIEILGLLKREHESVRVLVLSSDASGHEISAAMQAGAAAYVLKSMPLSKLLDTIRRVHAGEIVCLPEIARSLAGRNESNLSDRELGVLALMSKGMSNKEVAEELKLVEGTVKLHVSSILSKFGVSDRTQAILVGVKRGLVQLD